MLTADKKLYWETVRQCLQQLHGFSPTRAQAAVREYRKEIKEKDFENAVYHEEPYETSCDIAGVESDSVGQWAKYKEIADRYLRVSETSA